MALAEEAVRQLDRLLARYSEAMLPLGKSGSYLLATPKMTELLTSAQGAIERLAKLQLTMRGRL